MFPQIYRYKILYKHIIAFFIYFIEYNKVSFLRYLEYIFSDCTIILYLCKIKNNNKKSN